MSLIFTDGFDNYGSSPSTGQTWGARGSKWQASFLTETRLLATASTRFAYGSAAYWNNGSNAGIAHQVPSADEHATFIIGFALLMPGTFNLLIGSDSTSTWHEHIVFNAVTGQVTALRGFSGTSLGTSSTGLFTTNTWYYFETKVVLHDSTGSVTVKLNGTQILNLTNVDTKNGGTKSVFDSFYLYVSTGGSCVDDMYVCNGAGSVNNDFLGECRIATLRPNGAGNQNDLTGTGASSPNTYQNVDDNAVNTATYNSSATDDQLDLYAYENSPVASGTVKGVWLHTWGSKSDTGTKGLAPMVRHSGTDYEGSSHSLTTSSALYLDMYETNPGTSTAWTISDIDSAQFGAKVKAS